MEMLTSSLLTCTLRLGRVQFRTFNAVLVAIFSLLENRDLSAQGANKTIGVVMPRIYAEDEEKRRLPKPQSAPIYPPPSPHLTPSPRNTKPPLLPQSPTMKLHAQRARSPFLLCL